MFIVGEYDTDEAKGLGELKLLHSGNQYKDLVHMTKLQLFFDSLTMRR